MKQALLGWLLGKLSLPFSLSGSDRGCLSVLLVQWPDGKSYHEMSPQNLTSRGRIAMRTKCEGWRSAVPIRVKLLVMSLAAIPFPKSKEAAFFVHRDTRTNEETQRMLDPKFDLGDRHSTGALTFREWRKAALTESSFHLDVQQMTGRKR